MTSRDNIAEIVRTINGKTVTYGGKTNVWPGHSRGEPSSVRKLLKQSMDDLAIGEIAEFSSDSRRELSTMQSNVSHIKIELERDYQTRIAMDDETGLWRLYVRRIA